MGQKKGFLDLSECSQNPEEIDQNSLFYSKSLKNHVFRGGGDENPGSCVPYPPYTPFKWPHSGPGPVRSVPDPKTGGSKNPKNTQSGQKCQKMPIFAIFSVWPKIDILGGYGKPTVSIRQSRISIRLRHSFLAHRCFDGQC